MSYKGLCVGGVRAGEWVSNEKNILFEKFEGGRWPGPDGAVILVDVPQRDTSESTYFHVRGGGGCDFWVPEGKDRTWAMQELVRCYRREHLPPNPEADPEYPGTDASPIRVCLPCPKVGKNRRFVRTGHKHVARSAGGGRGGGGPAGGVRLGLGVGRSSKSGPVSREIRRKAVACLDLH